MERIKSKDSKPADRSKIDLPTPSLTVVYGRPLRVLPFGVALFLLFQLPETTLPRVAAAYVDPGTTGLLSQILYVLFYAALGGFFYFLRSIKRSLSALKQRLAKVCGAQTKSQTPREHLKSGPEI
jgi:hypothetical protein